MKYFIILITLLTVSTSFGQKYLSKETEEVKVNRNNVVFSSEKSLKENISQSSDLHVFSEIIDDATIQKQLNAQEMVTVFVVLDEAFSDLNKRKREALLSDKGKLKKMVSHLSIPGRVDKNGMEIAIKKNNGKAQFTTLEGTDLVVISENDKLYLVDSTGKKAVISATDFFHKNGLFHIIDKRLFLD